LNHPVPSFPSPVEGNRSSFRNTIFSRYLEFKTIDRVQKPSDSECYTPTSEHLRFRQESNLLIWRLDFTCSLHVASIMRKHGGNYKFCVQYLWFYKSGVVYKRQGCDRSKLECRIAAHPLTSAKMARDVIKEAWNFAFAPQLPVQGCTYLHNYK
jgi:hypothetical protein